MKRNINKINCINSDKYYWVSYDVMWGSRVKDGLFVFKSRDGFTGGVHLPLALARGGAGGMRYSNLSNNMMISKL
jgi:hypothetical protein